MEHKNTENGEINFGLLESRILSVNDSKLNKSNNLKKVLYDITNNRKPTLIVGTGGSKVVSYYLELILQRINGGVICEVIEPRDYFYKYNKDKYSNLVVISASGKSNGIKEILDDFKGNKYLICESDRKEKYNVVSWGNELYIKEKSFISLATSLCPMTLLLDTTISLDKELCEEDINKINDKIKTLIEKSKNKIEKLNYDFSDKNVLEIMSGYENKTSSYVLESNMIETGSIPVVIHDKGAFCHGRSNLMYNYRNNPLIYLSHSNKELDDLLLKIINQEYNNVLLFDTFDLNDSIFWKEYYLSLQMYYLSKYIADCKNIDLTLVDYNPNIVKKVYKYRGEM